MITKLEKFSLEAIKNAKEEAFEEIEVLLEGGNLQDGLLSIKRILADLLDSVEHFDQYATEDRETIEGFSKAEWVIFNGDETALFSLNEAMKLIFKNEIEDEGEYKKEVFHVGTEGIVLAKRKNVYSMEDKMCYLVHALDGVCIISEEALERKKEPNYQFAIGQEVTVSWSYFPYDSNLYRVFGYDEEMKNSFSDYKRTPKRPKGVIVGRARNIYSDHPLYDVKCEDARYFVPEDELS